MSVTGSGTARSTKEMPEVQTTPKLAGTKRKRQQEPRYYAVRIGRQPGVYQTWDECLKQVNGFKQAQFKSFPTVAEAELFIKNGLFKPSAKGGMKWYAVKNGKTPGIYTDWPTAEEQIRGWKAPKYKSFPTRAEAEAFMKGAELGNTGADVDEGAAKKSKKNTKKGSAQDAASSADIDESVEPGTGPLPSYAEDGFDPRIKLNVENGSLQYKSEQERSKVKMQATGLRKGVVLEIWTDGSSMGNGKVGARAGVGVYFGPQDSRNIEERLKGSRQTNQRAELTAIQRALDIAPKDRDVLVHTDSNYSIKCVTEWFVSWRRNGWATAAGKPVENRDLVEPILAKIEERKRIGSDTKFNWVKGHASNAGNVAADKLAVAGAHKPAVD